MSDTARLTILGSKGGPAIRPGGPNPTSMLLEIAGKRIVVDCGLGVTRGIVDAGVPLKTLDMVLITHLHSDHVLEFGPLIHTAWTAGLNTPVTVFGPAGTKAVWEGFLASLSYDIATRFDDEGRPDLSGLVALSEYAEGTVFSDDALKITALRVHHPPVTECYALKVEAAGRTIVFGADTAYFPPLAAFAKGADVLVHEAMLASGVDRIVALAGNGSRLKQHLLASHTFAEDAGRIAADAGVGHLVLNHLIPADDPDVTDKDWAAAVGTAYDGPLTISRDGLAIDIPAGDAQ